MKKQIGVPDSMALPLREFLNEQGIDLEVIAGGRCDVNIHTCNERAESDIDTIYSAGRIRCETARGCAKKIGISIRQMGKLLNHLDVKIRECSLGCFQ